MCIQIQMWIGRHRHITHSISRQQQSKCDMLDSKMDMKYKIYCVSAMIH